MKRLAMILVVAFTMGLATSSVSASNKVTPKKETKACTATDKKACCASSDKKACCNKDAKAEKK